VQRSGGRYDPETDRWTATTNQAAPSARSLHTAIWTGDSMLVWGGSESEPFGVLGDGGLYHPPR